MDRPSLQVESDATERPWYERALRWGQTNLTEIDPQRYDAAFWRRRWALTRIDGVIVNAGGIVAYYPSAYPQHRAIGLGDGDLFGDIVQQAREDGLAVIARMDSSRAGEALLDLHPEWFTRDEHGRPYRAGANYIACINSGYYGEFLPAVFAEIIERAHPDGFADNSWAGLDARRICYCDNCAQAFLAAAGGMIPRAHDWDDPVYRDWVRWNSRRRTEVWRENSRRTSEAGGPDCIWVGMIGGDQAGETDRFEVLHDIAKDARIFFVDHQRRTPRDGFGQNTDTGKRLHGLLGWDRLLPESMAMYSAGSGFFRATSMPEAEVRVWAAAAMAGGIQPWWHHISAVHEDLRQYDTPVPIFEFHERHQSVLVDRTPVAEVAVVWSEQNTFFHGREDQDGTAIAPYRGVVAALNRVHVQYLPVHIDDLAELDLGVRVVILPDVAVMTEAQAEVVRALVDRGVSLLATGETSAKDANGVRRPDFLLADVLGVHAEGAAHGSRGHLAHDAEVWSRHDYLRIDRSIRAGGVGAEDIEAVFAGLERTGLVSFGGRLEVVRVESGATAMTYVPPFPFYPPELAWLPPEPTATPALVLRVAPSGAKVAYLGADLDRVAGRESRPDHLRLLGNLVGWQLGDERVLRVVAPRGVECSLYRQGERAVLHLVHTDAPSQIPGTLDELVAVGPIQVDLAWAGAAALSARALVSEVDLELDVDANAGRVRFTVPVVEDHEIIVIGPGKP